MPADRCPLLVIQLCFRSLQSPGELAVRSWQTHVDLRSRRVGLQDNPLAGRSLNFVGHVGARDALPTCQRSDPDHSDHWQQSWYHEQKFNTLDVANCNARAEDHPNKRKGGACWGPRRPTRGRVSSLSGLRIHKTSLPSPPRRTGLSSFVPRGGTVVSWVRGQLMSPVHGPPCRCATRVAPAHFLGTPKDPHKQKKLVWGTRLPHFGILPRLFSCRFGCHHFVGGRWPV